MSATFAISLAIVTLGSCWASYRIGIWEEKERWLEKIRRRKERAARWAEFEEDEK
jgi:hypothetical protein